MSDEYLSWQESGLVVGANGRAWLLHLRKKRPYFVLLTHYDITIMTKAQQHSVSPEQAEKGLAPDTAPKAETASHNLSAPQIVEQIAILLQGDTLPERQQVERLKGLFYRKKQEMADQPEELELHEERMNDLLAQFKEQDRKRTEALAELHAKHRQEADELMARLEQVLASEDDFKHIYEQFHEIRQAWEALRPLSSQDESRLRKTFGALRERFYELKGINEELREYDFRKNLEAKRQIIEELRPLAQAEDVVAAIREMTVIAARWHDLGPVDREHRVEINATYKELSGQIYRRHQDYQDKRKDGERANQEAKEAIIVKLETILVGSLPERRKAWEELTEQVKALQEEWRTVGRAAKRENDKLYQRFRAGLDAFFQYKNSFIKKLSAEQQAYVATKRSLIERAKELVESQQDRAKTADALRKLQDEWKQTGTLAGKQAQLLWEEFRVPFDHFFTRGKGHEDKHDNEQKNLEAKRSIIEELRQLKDEEGDTLRERLQQLGEQWKAIGHVPRNQKQEINEAHKALLDELYARLRKGRTQRRVEGYGASIQNISGGELSSERQRMERLRERLRGELRTYEDNTSRLNISSSSSNPLLKDIERKRKELEENLAVVEEQIALLRSKGE